MNKLFQFIDARDDAQLWLVSFCGCCEITLEYFGGGYIGSLEQSCGTWQHTGTPAECLDAVRAMINRGRFNAE